MAKKKKKQVRPTNSVNKGKSTAKKPCSKKPDIKNKSVNKPPRSNNDKAKKVPKKVTVTNKKDFPDKFPFWARYKPNKNRTTLVVNEETIVNKKTTKQEGFFIHREATHTDKKGYEKIEPNPDKDDKLPMYLKRESKKPKRMFKPHNKNLDMPNELQEKYAKNNKK